MLASLGSLVLVATMGSSTSDGRLRSFITTGFFLAALLAAVLIPLERQRRHRTRVIADSRSEYLRHLGTVRATVRAAAAQQRAALLRLHPDPVVLPGLAEERCRVWERASTDPAFLQVRYGVGSQPLALELVAPDSAAIDRADPAAASALRRFLAVHREQPDLPVALDLRALVRVEICGPEEDVRCLARAITCSAAAFHSSDDLAVAVLASSAALPEWDWVKWLPHALSRRAADAVGPRRMVSTSLDELCGLLRSAPAERRWFGTDESRTVPHVVLVVDQAELPPDHVIATEAWLGTTVLELKQRPTELAGGRVLRLLVDDGVPGEKSRPAIRVLRLGDEPRHARPDRCDRATAVAFARRLSPLDVAAGSGAGRARAGGRTDSSSFMRLLGLDEIDRYDAESAWRTGCTRDRLRVPIGVGDDGAVVHLDLKESAQQGMGPHGLVIGATGSGKSELLRTLVLGLALTHSPEQLNIVLVDFKGGATFAGMATMPHVSAMITNLANELTLVDRMHDALSGELVRRQELLRSSGNHASLSDYERARAAGAALAPLPSLLIVVDEFSEMLSVKPGLLDVFVAIGRLGRSLGLHLLLASQRLEEGRLRGLESHLSYRIGLRTFSAQESRSVLGVPDAHDLPPQPGHGFLRPDPSTLVRFTAAYVSRPSVGLTVAGNQPAADLRILPWTSAEVPHAKVPEPDGEPSTAREEQGSLLDVAIGRMTGLGPATHQVWLPTLDVPDTLDELMADLSDDNGLGLVSGEWRALGGLTVPLGTVDRPREQRRDPLVVDLSGAGGHVGVVGGPRSGKSTLLRTLVTGLSLTTTPLESQFFVLDLGGAAFAALRSLPHVAGIGTRSESDVVRRIVAEVTWIVDRREEYFRTQGIDSAETYRDRRRLGRADDGYGDVFLVVDGWGALRPEFDDLEQELQQLAARGLAFGCHLLTASARWSDYRPAVRDLLGTRLELRLGDPADSEIDRRRAAQVPGSRPGRGLLPAGLHFLAALPRIDGDPDAATLADGVEDLVARVGEAWGGPVGPKLRLLPDRVSVDDLLVQADEQAIQSGRLLIGLDEKQLAPVGLDPHDEPHWLLFGDGRSGKSAALRTYLHEVMRTRTPQQAQLVVVDYRRSLLGELPDAYLLDYLTSAAEATRAVADLATYLGGRLPGPDVTAQQLRHRSWWTGADVFIVVDDYDLVATTMGSPLHALLPLLAQARDVGLHLVVARRSGGASRALHEPVIQSLRDLAVPGLLLSGSPDEGALIGHVRPVPAPAGRGRLVTRDHGVEVVQLAWREPAL